MKILLYEAAVAGDLTESISSSQDILCEGYAMAEALTVDFQAAGHEVTLITSNEYLSSRKWSGISKVKFVSTESRPRDVLRHRLSSHDATYVVAPETGYMLAGLVEMVEKIRCPEASLNFPASKLRQVSDKSVVYDILMSRGVKVPRGLTLSLTKPMDSTESVSSLGFPVILKPPDGTGCSRLNLAFTTKEVAAYIAAYDDDRSRSSILAQEYVRGIPASVSLLCSESAILPISLNRQVVLLERRPGHSRYVGGVVPLEHPARSQAYDAACEAVRSLGLKRGYVGVDVILSRDGPVIVDVNPRLTTSYLGLRKTMTVNIGEWIVKSCLYDELPIGFRHVGYSIFLKILTTPLESCCLKGRCSTSHISRNYGRRDDQHTAFTLIEGYGSTLSESVASLRKSLSPLRYSSQGS